MFLFMVDSIAEYIPLVEFNLPSLKLLGRRVWIWQSQYL